MLLYRAARGFTLVELVMVIMITAFISLGSVQFISHSVLGMSDAASRQQMATLGWILSEKISRDLRTALPNSIRMNAGKSCVEFIPTHAASRYISMPTVVGADRFNSVKIVGYNVPGSTDRIAVYPNSESDIYSLSSPGALSPLVKEKNNVSADEDEVVLKASHRFITDSPERRFYVTADPVTYCILAGNVIRRYRDYGVHAAIGTNLNAGEVMATRVTAGEFDYEPATLTRNAVVRSRFTLIDASSGEGQTFDQEVQIRNVP